MDLMPTYLNMAGLEVPAVESPHALDGTSLKQLLFRAQPLPERTVFWRIGRRRAARSGPWKLVWLEEESPMLFDLDDDISETNNRAFEKPELTTKLQRDYEEWEADVSRQMDIERSDPQ
jgi:arylsulfatase A-like enzyme